ncbi:hypothetical protein CAter282_1496 [Collimonas arenae]|uniref:Uncharacterized protein n=1 Tax=Collimonas arenae TaxID=279058 RepID=A0A127PNR2_9BURK|nr:hypothetical protein CAter10_1619 [Collimonas arenae]AMP09285.1 hypothetical protein CAter282_1496 [Collimonas arenae]
MWQMRRHLKNCDSDAFVVSMASGQSTRLIAGARAIID